MKFWDWNEDVVARKIFDLMLEYTDAQLIEVYNAYLDLYRGTKYDTLTRLIDAEFATWLTPEWNKKQKVLERLRGLGAP